MQEKKTEDTRKAYSILLALISYPGSGLIVGRGGRGAGDCEGRGGEGGRGRRGLDGGDGRGAAGHRHPPLPLLPGETT